MKLRKRFTYKQEEIAEQTGHIKELMSLRDKTRVTDEIQRFNTAIEVAQEVLIYMEEKSRVGK